MADIYLMCGIPGCGKSTFLKNHVTTDENSNNIIISRDEIRFSLLKNGEEYFSHEDEVVKIFWEKINNAIAANKNVFIDQTSITPNSRKWLLQHIKGYNHANIIWINEDIETCLERNKKRKGTRSYVPEKVIYDMSRKFIKPSLNEGFYRIYKYNSKDKTVTYEGVI